MFSPPLGVSKVVYVWICIASTQAVTTTKSWGDEADDGWDEPYTQTKSNALSVIWMSARWKPSVMYCEC